MYVFCHYESFNNTENVEIYRALYLFMYGMFFKIQIF